MMGELRTDLNINRELHTKWTRELMELKKSGGLG